MTSIAWFFFSLRRALMTAVMATNIASLPPAFITAYTRSGRASDQNACVVTM